MDLGRRALLRGSYTAGRFPGCRAVPFLSDGRFSHAVASVRQEQGNLGGAASRLEFGHLAYGHPTPGAWGLDGPPLPSSKGWAWQGMLAGLWSLGRSFGIAPADRGLVTRGLYRMIRHPMYASELVFNAGFLLANPSWTNALALLLIAGTQIARIVREERVIGDYSDYAARVRWRLIPGIW
jgi:hypothetical protein